MLKELRLIAKSENLSVCILRFAPAGSEIARDEVTWGVPREQANQFTVGDYYNFDMRPVPKVNESKALPELPKPPPNVLIRENSDQVEKKAG